MLSDEIHDGYCAWGVRFSRRCASFLLFLDNTSTFANTVLGWDETVVFLEIRIGLFYREASMSQEGVVCNRPQLSGERLIRELIVELRRRFSNTA